jgi:hypothetical protein
MTIEELLTQTIQRREEAWQRIITPPDQDDLAEREVTRTEYLLLSAMSEKIESVKIAQECRPQVIDLYNNFIEIANMYRQNSEIMADSMPDYSRGYNDAINSAIRVFDSIMKPYEGRRLL